MTTAPYQDITHRIIAAMSVALEMQGLGFESQKAVEIFFEDAAVGLYYLDYLVEHTVVVELKALSELNSSHLAQTITYLTGTGCRVGLLINFGTSKLEWRRVFPPQHVQAHIRARRQTS